jgi:hypothetical protein
VQPGINIAGGTHLVSVVCQKDLETVSVEGRHQTYRYSSGRAVNNKKLGPAQLLSIQYLNRPKLNQSKRELKNKNSP